MFNGKQKAVTFSFDDGVTQDRRFVEMLDRYGLKGTFNLNSELLGKEGTLLREGKTVLHNKISPEEARSLYKNHEIAAHTLTHPTLTQVANVREIVRQVEKDRENLSKIAGYEVTGMAYPGGGVNADARVAQIIKNKTGVRYARTTDETHSFSKQTDLFLFRPTVRMTDFDALFSLAETFLSLPADEYALFYIWGHTYEFDIHDTWDKAEDFCRLISGRPDVFYGTNAQVFLTAARSE